MKREGAPAGGSGIAQQPADADLTAGDGAAGAVRQFNDESGIGSDTDGECFILTGWTDDLGTRLPMVQLRRVDFPNERFGRLGEDMLTQEHVVQDWVMIPAAMAARGTETPVLPHRDSFVPQLLGEILPLLRDIDTDADDRAVDGAAFGIAGELGENAADLAAAKNDIIGPLDGRRRRSLLLQHLTDRKPCAAGKQTERGGVAIGAEEG